MRWILLVGSIGFVGGCDDEEDTSDTQQVVAIDLALSMQSNYADQSRLGRMSADITQQEGLEIRPLQELKLYGFNASMLVGEAQDGMQSYHFTPMTLKPGGGLDFLPHNNGDINSDQATFTTTGQSLPIGTNRMVGFGAVNAAFAADRSADAEQAFIQGATATCWGDNTDFEGGLDQLSDFYFYPQSIAPRGGNWADEVKYPQGNKILKWINQLFTVEVNGKRWADFSREGTLAAAYADVVSNRSGAYAHVHALMESVYNQLYLLSNESTDEGAMAKALMQKLLTVEDWSFQPVENSVFSEKQWLLERQSAELLEKVDFPRDCYLPDGSVVLDFDEESRRDSPEYGVTAPFRFCDRRQAGVLGFPAPQFAFPAELLYSVDTSIRTLPERVSAEGWTTANSWQNFVNSYFSAGKPRVTASTVAVALEQPLHYLVGCLDTRAYLTADRLPDARTVDNKMDVYVKEGFPVTGVLVGMQEKVGWTGKSYEETFNVEKIPYICYDRVLAVPAARVKPLEGLVGSLPHLSYTLVLSSPVADLTVLNHQDEGMAEEEGMRTRQFVILELENTAEDFYGVGKQLIPNGSRFYLVGELNLREQLDQMKAGGEYSVFRAGATTRLTLRIESLAGAYSYVPDLRVPSLKIALHTDWNWQNGIIYDDHIAL